MKAAKGKAWPRRTVETLRPGVRRETVDDGLFVRKRTLYEGDEALRLPPSEPLPDIAATVAAVRREAERVKREHRASGLEHEVWRDAAEALLCDLLELEGALAGGNPRHTAAFAWCAGWNACKLWLREGVTGEVRARRNSRESLHVRTRSAAEEAAWAAVAAAEARGERHGKTLHVLYGKADGTLGERSFLTLLARRRKSFSTLRR